MAYWHLTDPKRAFCSMFMRVLTDLTDPAPQGGIPGFARSSEARRKRIARESHALLERDYARVSASSLPSHGRIGGRESFDEPALLESARMGGVIRWQNLEGLEGGALRRTRRSQRQRRAAHHGDGRHDGHYADESGDPH